MENFVKAKIPETPNNLAGFYHNFGEVPNFDLPLPKHTYTAKSLTSSIVVVILIVLSVVIGFLTVNKFSLIFLDQVKHKGSLILKNNKLMDPCSVSSELLIKIGLRQAESLPSNISKGYLACKWYDSSRNYNMIIAYSWKQNYFDDLILKNGGIIKNIKISKWKKLSIMNNKNNTYDNYLFYKSKFHGILAITDFNSATDEYLVGKYSKAVASDTGFTNGLYE